MTSSRPRQIRPEMFLNIFVVSFNKLTTVVVLIGCLKKHKYILFLKQSRFQTRRISIKDSSSSRAAAAMTIVATNNKSSSLTSKPFDCRTRTTPPFMTCVQRIPRGDSSSRLLRQQHFCAKLALVFSLSLSSAWFRTVFKFPFTKKSDATAAQASIVSSALLWAVRSLYAPDDVHVVAIVLRFLKLKALLC